MKGGKKDELLNLSLEEEYDTVCRSDVNGIMFVTVGHAGQVSYHDLLLAWFKSFWVSSVLMNWLGCPQETHELMKELKRDGILDSSYPNYPVWTIQEVWERLSPLLNSCNEEKPLVGWASLLPEHKSIKEVIFIEAGRDHLGKTIKDPKRYYAAMKCGTLKIYERFEV